MSIFSSSPYIHNTTERGRAISNHTYKYDSRVRKVKCDEEKPHCRRCTSTGRKCDGYSPTPPPGVLWHRPRHLSSGISGTPGEGRCLQFFCEVVGPLLSGPLDSYFWTHLAMQFSQFEPAVRHSLISISSLYEQLQFNSGPHTRLADNSLALFHYNAAIRELKALNNEPLVLLVCVLFVCIEFLQGHREAAIQHCRHGIEILKNVEDAFPWAREYLAPIFRRLNMVPLFFGIMPGTFPRVTELGEDSFPDSFASLADAQFILDDILNRTIHLIRYSDMYILGGRSLEGDPAVAEHLEEKRSINRALDLWDLRFQKLDNPSSESLNLAKAYCNLVVRYNVARVWSDATFEPDEMVFDKHIDAFKLMVDEATKINPVGTIVDSTFATSQAHPKFIFEMGFTPLFYFVLLKCRSLVTRIRALALVRRLGVARENMWDTAGMLQTGRRLIEIEHGIKVDENGLPCDPASVDWTALPPDEIRVRSTSTESKLTIQEDENGRLITGRMTAFYKLSPEGKIYAHLEFLPEDLGSVPIEIDLNPRLQLMTESCETPEEQFSSDLSE